jgi:transposase
MLPDPRWLSLAAAAEMPPPFTTVQNRLYAWRDSGVWEQIVCVLVTAVREAEGKNAAPRRMAATQASFVARNPELQEERGGSGAREKLIVLACGVGKVTPHGRLYSHKPPHSVGGCR